MLWIIPAWVVSLIAVFFLGYHFRGLTKKIEHLEETIKLKVDKPAEPETPKSVLIDPTDEVQNALYEHEQMMKKLNG